MDSTPSCTRILSDLLDANRQRSPDAVCLVDPPNRARIADGPARHLTWAGLGQRVDRMALTLADQGLVRGDIVIIAAPTLHETLVAQLACVSLGLICVGIPIQYREAEVSDLIRRLSPKALIGHARLGAHANAQMLATLAQAAAVPPVLLAHGADLPPGAVTLDAQADTPLDLSAAQRLAAALTANRPGADDVAFVVLTSGTLARPKAVPRTHAEILCLAGFLEDAADFSPGGCFLSPRMLNSVGAIANGFVAWLHSAARMVLHHPFDLDVFLAQIAAERPEVTSCPPAILNMILKRIEAGEAIDLGGLHHITSGSAMLNPQLVRLFQDRFGITLVNAYGSSEGAMLLASGRDFPDPELRARCFPRLGAGRFQSKLAVLGGIETRIVDPTTEQDLNAPGAIGELRLKGPTILRAYWDSPQETRAAFDAGGWFRTGDLFAIDEADANLLRFAGRLKNIIVRGGLNISAEEIEGLVMTHPDVAEAVAVPVPDPLLGEKVGLVVVPKPGCAPELSELAGHLRDTCRIAVFKLPEQLRLLNALPTLPSGKTDLTALRALFRTDPPEGEPR